MNKFISLRKQRILKYFPFFNCLILFVWLFNYSHTERDFKVFWKSLILIFAVCIPMVFFQIIISEILAAYSTALTIFNFATIYIIPFVLGYALIKYQERVIAF